MSNLDIVAYQARRTVHNGTSGRHEISFFKSLLYYIVTLSCVAVDVPSSYIMGFTLFRYHVGNVHNVNHSGGFVDPCSSWVLAWSGNLKYVSGTYVSGTFLFPVYMWFILTKSPECLYDLRAYMHELKKRNRNNRNNNS